VGSSDSSSGDGELLNTPSTPDVSDSVFMVEAGVGVENQVFKNRFFADTAAATLSMDNVMFFLFFGCAPLLDPCEGAPVIDLHFQLRGVSVRFHTDGQISPPNIYANTCV
jgi:hypothetical protein